MKLLSWATGLLVAWMILSLCFAVIGKINNKTERDCRPIPREQSIGSIRCWSGGQLVYQNSIYNNGGVLCASDGHEIKITGGKSLCVIESGQDDPWNPPAASDQ